MPTVSEPTKAPIYRPERNTVLSVAAARPFVIRFTDQDGLEETALILLFGTQDDGRPGVFVMANQAEMQATLRIANKSVREGVLRLLPDIENPAIDDAPKGVSVPSGIAGLTPENASFDLDTQDL